MKKNIIDFKKYRIDKWEKVYRSARDLMDMLWYKKWERFYWVIKKTIDKANKNWVNTRLIFVESVPKSTWWRPRVDFELSKYACYLISLECDSKKEEVEFARLYFEHELRSDNRKIEEKKLLDKKIKQETKEKLVIEKRYFTKNRVLNNFKKRIKLLAKIIILILFLSFLISFFDNSDNTNLKNYKLKEKNLIEDRSIEIIKENLEKKWENINQVEKTIIDEDKKNKDIVKEKDILWKIKDYLLELKNWNIEYLSNLDSNIRNNFTISLKWEDLIKSFFIFWNLGDYKDSCSLLSIYKCNALENLSWFKRFWDKTVDWYKIDDVYIVEDFEWVNIYCVKTSYKLKNDLSPNRIEEIYHYKTEIFSDWREEIISRVCEWITKWNRNIKCPYKTNKKYCK